MTDNGEEKPRVTISPRECADACHRELLRRHRSYPYLVKSGKMTEVEAEAGYAEMRCARDQLSVLAEYQIECRTAIEKARDARRELSQSQIATAVADAFPGAVPVETRPLDGQSEFMEPGPEGDGGLADVFPPDRSAVRSPAP